MQSKFDKEVTDRSHLSERADTDRIFADQLKASH